MVDFEANVKKIIDDKRISPENRQHMQNYVDEAIFAKRKIKTVNNIIVTMNAFNTFMNNKDFKKITSKDIKRYIASLDVKESSQDKYLLSIKKFITVIHNYDKKDDEEPINPPSVSWICVKRKKTHVNPDALPTPTEINALIAADTNLRNQAIISLFFDTGARLGEICNLNRGDVRNNNSLVQNGVDVHFNSRIQSTKKVERIIPVSQSIKYLMPYLNYYDSTYLKNGANPNQLPLFFSEVGRTKGARLNDHSMYRIIKQAEKDAKKNGKIRQDLNIHPHIFRHAHVTAMLKNPQISDQIIKKRVGWTPDSPMMQAYTHITDKDASIAYYQSQGQVVKEEEVEKYELNGWHCIRCGTENPETNNTCFQCNTPNDVELIDNSIEKMINVKMEKLFTRFIETGNTDFTKMIQHLHNARKPIPSDYKGIEIDEGGYPVNDPYENVPDTDTGTLEDAKKAVEKSREYEESMI